MGSKKAFVDSVCIARTVARVVVCLTLAVLYMSIFRWQDLERWMHAPIEAQEPLELPVGHPPIHYQGDAPPNCPLGFTEEDAGISTASASDSATCMQLYNRGWYSAFFSCVVGF